MVIEPDGHLSWAVAARSMSFVSPFRGTAGAAREAPWSVTRARNEDTTLILADGGAPLRARVSPYEHLVPNGNRPRPGGGSRAAHGPGS